MLIATASGRPGGVQTAGPPSPVNDSRTRSVEAARFAGFESADQIFRRNAATLWASSGRKSVCIFVRQLLGPHFSTCA